MLFRMNEIFRSLHNSKHAKHLSALDIQDDLGIAAKLVPLEGDKLLAFARQKLLAEEEAIRKETRNKSSNLVMDIMDHQFIDHVNKDLQKQYEQISQEVADELLSRCLMDAANDVEDLLPDLLQHLLP